MRAFADYVAKFGKAYSTSAEFNQRAVRFAEVDRTITEWNSNPSRTHSLAHNKFSDWYNYEFSAILTYQSRANQLFTTKLMTLDETNIADYVNWV